MKKFLSLALALVMTLSLVVVGAGATEYKDLTDKDEIKYEEAVAVLNRIGVITGYEDGSFQPENELTRGAAAKIIVSLLIGPEAAANLANDFAPYPDVPAGHDFAGVISFCKTSHIIDGYPDGTFRPAGTLTGYAFSKMLLNALGYQGDLEGGFTGDGWMMNVARVGQFANLFDRLSFKGNEAVSRQDACQLALNTLKATMVEYSNSLNVNVTGENTTVAVSGGQVRSYVTSNQDFAKNIITDTKEFTNDGWYTVQFAEEHFVDLKMTANKHQPTDDEYGRPSSEWSYKKVTIGTYPLEADFEYTTQVAHDVSTVSDATRVRALGLNGYELWNDKRTDSATLWINGVEYKNALEKVADIAKYTDNGTLVQVYVDADDADWIRDVVVIKTQLMEVKRVGSDYVTLDRYDGDPSDITDDNKDGFADQIAFNAAAIDEKLDRTEVNDEYFDFLKGLKVGDIVAVVPVADDHDPDTFKVGKAYAPETVTGTLTSVDTYGSVVNGAEQKNTVNVTVGGTKYNVALWNKNLIDIDNNKLKVTTRDVTLYLDEYGNAMLATNVGATSNFMVVSNYRSSLNDGVLVTIANGYDLNGEAVSLNIGAVDNPKTKWPIGTLVHYTNDPNSNTADWKLNYLGVFNVGRKTDPTNYEIKSSNSSISLTNWPLSRPDTVGESPLGATTDNPQSVTIDSGIKFIYVSIDDDGEVDAVEVRSGVQNADYDDLNKALNNVRAQACVKLKNDGTAVTDASYVQAVVIKEDSSVANVNNVLYIRDYYGSATVDANGKVVQGYTVAMMTADGLLDEEVIYAYKDLGIGQFARYTKSTHADHPDDFYRLRGYDAGQKSVSTLRGVTISKIDKNNKNLIKLNTIASEATADKFNFDTNWISDVQLNIGDNAPNLNNANYVLRISGAKFVDLTKNGIDKASDLYDVMYDDKNPQALTLSVLFNDNTDSDDFRQAYMVVITAAGKGTPSKDDEQQAQAGDYISFEARQVASGNIAVEYTLKKPDWATSDATTTFDVKLYVDGVLVYTEPSGAVSPGTRTINLTTAKTGVSKDDNWTIKINDTDLTWSKVVAEWVFKTADGEEEPAVFKAGEIKAIETNGTLLNGPELDDDTYNSSNIGYITSVTGTSGPENTLSTVGLTPGAPCGAGAKVWATGKSKVVFTITGLVKLPTRYSVTLPGNAALSTYAAPGTTFDTTDGATELQFTVNNVAATAGKQSYNPGTLVTIRAKLNATFSNAAQAYRVKVQVLNETPVTLVLGRSAHTGNGETVYTGALASDITANDIKVLSVEEIMPLKATGLKVVSESATSGYIYEVTFDREIVATNTITTSNISSDGSASCSGVTVMGKVMQVEMNAAIGNGEYIEIAQATEISDKENLTLLAKQTITRSADGTTWAIT